MTLFDQVRASCARVTNKADYVSINLELLHDYAETLTQTPDDTPFYDTEHHFLGNEAETVAYILILDTINFGSGYFPFLKKREALSGYFTVSTSLKDWFEQKGPPTPEQLANLELHEVAAIFQQPLKHPGNKELMQLFTQALNDLGALLTQHYNSKYTTLIQKAEHSANTLGNQLLAMPMFQDKSLHKDQEVFFYKRLQITASDLALALNNKGLGFFEDINEVTLFADNLVPHVLHVDGILKYEQNLEDRLKRNPFLEAGSQEEVEMRAVSIHAVELLTQHLQNQGNMFYTRDLDMVLWNRGLNQKYRDAPRHRTQSVFY